MIYISPSYLNICKHYNIQMAEKQNNYPVVLMPGFFGWGRDELEGVIPYFGGLHGDLQEQLKGVR